MTVKERTAQFEITTTQRTVVIEAESIEHARDIFTGKCFPVGVPPAPRHPVTGTAHVPYEGHAVHGSFAPVTPEWQAWYDEHGAALSNRLWWEHGECMVNVKPVEARPAGWVEREPTLKTCAYSHVEVVHADDLTGDDIGALEPDETGFIATCHCGWTTEIRYSQIAAQSAVCTHVVNANGVLA